MSGKIHNACRVSQVFLLGALLAGCSQAGTVESGTTPQGGKRAAATIEPKGSSGVTGKAIFTERGGNVTFRLAVRNAPPGQHAVHIHEFGDCSSPDGKSAGGHWNPTGMEHGKWGTSAFHLGDIGNLQVGSDGTGTLTLTTELWSLDGPDESRVRGHAIIVHEGADDFVSQPTGKAGGRIACGVIE